MPDKPRTVYEILCDMFPKKDVDYAMRAAKEKRPPNLKHLKGCKLDRDHLDKCRVGIKLKRQTLWGIAIVREDEDNGVNFWDCEVCNEECDVKEPKLTLRAEHFKVGTVIEIYEPLEEVGDAKQ